MNKCTVNKSMKDLIFKTIKKEWHPLINKKPHPPKYEPQFDYKE